MEKRRLLYWLWLASALGIANRSTKALFDRFGDPRAIYEADQEALERIEGLSRASLRALCDKRMDRAARVLDLCERGEISVLTYTDEAYPELLRAIEAPPVLLYYRGRLPNLNRRLCLAMVGTRKMSEYGMDSAYKLSYELAAANAVIVSGMAFGIDGVCSSAAIAAGGDTVAVLGCGIDVLYPKQHRALRNEICEHGAIVSEYPPATRPLSHHFPERNRIICGMSQATLVIEGDLDSGALITARKAFEQGRDVYALPGNVDRETARGTNKLLDEGAHPLLSVKELLWNYRLMYLSISSEVFTIHARTTEKTDVALLERYGVLRSSGRARHQKSNGQQRNPSEEGKVSTPPTSEDTVKERELSEELLASLSPIQADIMRTLAERGEASTDDLYALPYSFGEISAALTQLEIRHLIKRLSGSQIALC